MVAQNRRKSICGFSLLFLLVNRKILVECVDGKAAEGFKDLREQMIQDAKDANAFDLDTQYQLLLELGLEDEAAKAELAKMAGALEGVPLTIDDATFTYTKGQIYDSTGAAVEGATIDGLIGGVEDPRAKAAQELAALEQG